MLDVLCSEMELGEYGEVLEVGDVIRRPGVRRRGEWFGTGLDRIEYWFDRYARVVGGGVPLTIGGQVDAIASVHTRITRGTEGRWGPLVGSAWIEPLASTAATRRPLARIAWQADAGASGRAYGRPDRRDGDESLWGWRVTLTDVVMEP